MTEKKNLYQKLLEIRKQVPYLQKDAEGFGYKYAKGSVLLSLLRPKMDELGVFLHYDVPEMETTEVTRQKFDKNTKKTISYSQGRVKMKYIFTFTDTDNPADKIITDHWFQGVGDDIQDIGGYDTYATRYFLIGFFNIPSDKADPDAHDNAIEKYMPIACVSPDQIIEIETLINGHVELREKVLKHIPGKKLENLTVDRYPAVLAWVDKFISENKEKNNA